MQQVSAMHVRYTGSAKAAYWQVVEGGSNAQDSVCDYRYIQALQGALVGVPCRAGCSEHVDTGSSPRVSKMKKLLVSIVFLYGVSHAITEIE